MRVGAAFGALESHRAALEIADYSISQPTLENVFIKTVQRFSGDERPSLSGAPNALDDDDDDDAVDKAPTCAGCTRPTHKILAYGSWVAVFGCLVAYNFAHAVSDLIPVFVFLGIFSCVGCCCVLRPPPVPE